MEQVSTPAWLAAAQPYLSLLNGAEDTHGIPRNLLTRIAWQESHFRADIISGAMRSPAGAVGIMQLMPQFFPNAGISTALDISTAATLLANLYARFGDWQVAVAAYNWGQGNVHHEIATDGQPMLADMPAETQAYVKGVFTDVPIPGALLPLQTGALA